MITRKKAIPRTSVAARNRLNDLLDDLGMPHSTGPVWEEESNDSFGEEEEGGSLPDCTDPYIADQCGHLVITTWGDIYELPQTLWQQRVSCPVLAVLASIGGQSYA